MFQCLRERTREREEHGNGDGRMTDGQIRMNRNMDEQRRMYITGTQAQLKVLNCRQTDVGGEVN